MFCTKTKEFLSKKGIGYTERNVAEDEAAMEELQKLGFYTTPVTLIDGEVIVGFDVKKLENLLG
ncbi:MAG: glutaredoxin family protein [Limisphaerales bacterium]